MILKSELKIVDDFCQMKTIDFAFKFDKGIVALFQW